MPITLTKPVPEAFEFPPLIGHKKISEENRTGDSGAFLHEVVFSSIATVAWAVQRKDCRREFLDKNSAKSRKSQT